MTKRRKRWQRLIWIALSLIVVGGMLVFTAAPTGRF